MKNTDKINKEIDLLKAEILKKNFLNSQELASLALGLKGLFENTIDKVDNQLDKNEKVKFESLLYLIKPAKELLKKDDFESFGEAIAYMKVKLIEISSNSEKSIKMIKKIQQKMDKLGI